MHAIVSCHTVLPKMVCEENRSTTDKKATVTKSEVTLRKGSKVTSGHTETKKLRKLATKWVLTRGISLKAETHKKKKKKCAQSIDDLS